MASMYLPRSTTGVSAHFSCAAFARSTAALIAWSVAIGRSGVDRAIDGGFYFQRFPSKASPNHKTV